MTINQLCRGGTALAGRLGVASGPPLADAPPAGSLTSVGYGLFCRMQSSSIEQRQVRCTAAIEEPTFIVFMQQRS
jgi:hypothetical protein